MCTPGRSHLHYEEKVVQCEERECTVSERLHSTVGGQGVCCEERVCSIKNVTSAVAGREVCSTNQSSDILQHSQNRPTGDRWLKF